jgi:type II secretory pathway pseudopilin PulG
MIQKRRGTTLVEWVVVIGLIILLVGGVLFALFTSVGARLSELNQSIQ